MKVRQGFVSNSSSSSFVILGAKIDTSIWDELDDELRRSIIKRHDIIENYESTDIFIGLKLATADSDDSDLDKTQTSFEDIQEYLEMIKSTLKGISDLNVGLFTGSICG